MTATDTGVSTQTPPDPLAHARVAGTQQDEHALTALQRGSRRGEAEIPTTRHHQVHGPDHWVGPGGVRPPTRTGPLSVRRNASS